MNQDIAIFMQENLAQHLSSGHEVRYFSEDPEANGETDFKGETSTLDGDMCIEF